MEITRKDICIRCCGKMRTVNAPNVSLLLHELISSLPKDKFREPLNIVVSVCEQCGKIEIFVQAASTSNSLSLPIFDVSGCGMGYSSYSSQRCSNNGDDDNKSVN